MKNIKIEIIGLSLVLGIISPSFIFAATEAGLKPGNFFYIFDTASEKFALFFTFNPEKKAKKALEYADERLAEIEAVAETNPDAVKEALTNYESNVALATEKSKEVRGEEQEENLLNLITDNASKNQEVLSAILIKVPEEAKAAITQAIEASKRGQEEARKQIAELKQEVEVLKQEIAELKKLQKTEPVAVPSVDAKTSIKELKEKIEELKKQEPQQEVKEENLPLILINSEGRSLPIDNPSMNSQRVQDLIDVGFFVKQGKLPEGIIIKSNETSVIPATPATPANPATTPATPATPAISQNKDIEISSVNISQSLNLVRIEWQTNIPTNSKVFLSGGGLYSKIYNSESGLSTRHMVNVVDLCSGGMNYSYEIESIADGGAVKRQGSFATAPTTIAFQSLGENKFTFTSNNKLSFKKIRVSLGDIDADGQQITQVHLGSSSTGKGITVDRPSTISEIGGYFDFNLPDGFTSPFRLGVGGGMIDYQNNKEGNSGTIYSYQLGIKANGTEIIDQCGNPVVLSEDKLLEKNILNVRTGKLDAVVRIDPSIVVEDWNKVITLGYGENVGIGTFSFRNADELISIRGIEVIANGNPSILYRGLSDQTYQKQVFENENAFEVSLPRVPSGRKIIVTISAFGAPKQTGNYTFTITKIITVGQRSGLYREVQGLPVTFHYSVQ